MRRLSTLQPPTASETVALLRAAIERGLPGASIEVTPGSPRHFSVRVVAQEFAGQTRVAAQRMVYRCIADLMRGDDAPVHAIDLLRTELPAPARS